MLDQELHKYVTQMDFVIKEFNHTDQAMDNLDMKSFRRLFARTQNPCDGMVEMVE